MSTYPLMLDGSALSAVVAGGGRVATRKAIALVSAGARVHVVAPGISPQLEQLAAENELLRLTRERFAEAHFGDALLVIAATNDASVNAQIAAGARARGRLINVVTAPELGNCATPAVHRAGEVTVAVTADRVPTAAARIRDRVARIVDARYAGAVRELTLLRASLLERAARDRWIAVNESLVGQDFCDCVEANDFDARLAEWR
jgi:siroheme synthase-like protein